MKYIDINIKINSSDIQKTTDILNILDISGIYIEDYSDMDDCELVKQIGLVDQDLLEKDKTVANVHIYFDVNLNITENIEFVKKHLDIEKIDFVLTYNNVDEQDYANAWKQYYKPLKVGKNLVIVPEWEEYIKNDSEIILTINPGMAFGTGTHETTSLCLESLENIIKKDDEMLDIGCGSGILSIAGLLFGAKNAIGIDIDKNAVKISCENVELNNLSNKFTGLNGNLLDQNSAVSKKLENKTFDVITANIVADIIIEINSFIKKHIKIGGYYIISGIIEPRLSDVMQSIQSNNLHVVKTESKKGWVCIIVQNV